MVQKLQLWLPGSGQQGVCFPPSVLGHGAVAPIQEEGGRWGQDEREAWWEAGREAGKAEEEFTESRPPEDVKLTVLSIPLPHAAMKSCKKLIKNLLFDLDVIFIAVMC